MQLNLPLYNITPDMTDENQGMFLVSLVENPAIEVDFLAFNNEEKLMFAVQDEEKHIVTGPAIIADVPIYRRNKNGEFYVQFRKEDIPGIVEKFMQRGLSNFVNIQHDENTLSNTDAVLVESYFVNKERGIVPNEFANVTDGSWITSYKILNEDIWQQIKAGDLRGFSIEISAELEPVKLEKQKTAEEISDDEIMTNCFDINGAIASIVRKNQEETNNIPDLNVYSDAAADYAIENGYVVMINYTGNEATGARQCLISARGLYNGKPALRVFQKYGDSVSGADAWKILLIHDISSFHVLDYLDKEDVRNEAGWGSGEQNGGTPGGFDVTYKQVQ